MYDQVKTIAFDYQGIDIPAELIKPLPPIAKRLKIATDALAPVNNFAAKEQKTRLNDATPCAGKYKAIQAVNTTKENLKEAHREARRQIKADIKAINAEAVPHVRRVLEFIRKPIAEFHDMHAERERDFAKLVGVPFEPSTSLQAVAQALAWVDRLIAGEPTLATIDRLVKI